MDMIRKVLLQLKAQLAGLTVSQKLLIGLLGIVMLATVFFTVVFSAKPAMVPLIAQSMSAEEINRVKMSLEGKYPYTIEGDKVLVPAEQQYAIRGALLAEEALPKDLTTAFSRVIASATPFSTSEMNTRAWNNAAQEELSRLLTNFPYIERGEVIIAHGQYATLGKPALPSTASVTVKVKNGAVLTGSQVRAIAGMVAGAVAGMRREDVHITDGNRPYQVQANDLQFSSDVLEYKRNIEEDFTRKLLMMFSHYGDVKIAVNAVPDYSSRVRDTETVDPKNVVSRELTVTSRETNSTEGGAPEGQPGVPPNTGMSVDTAGSSGRRQSASTSDTSTQNVVKIGSIREHATIMSGTELKELSASLTLPRSYFVKVFQKLTHDTKDPDDTDPAFRRVIDEGLKGAVALAKNAIGAKTEDQIRVDWFDDTINMHPDNVVLASPGLAGGSLGGIMQYAKQGVLAIVALGTLGMMMMMIKRAVPAPEAGEIDPSVFFSNAVGTGGTSGGKKRRGEVGQLNTADDIFGEANEGEAVLSGIELNDADVQSRKMVDEVSTMVKENPENAAALVKRWMTKGK
jgi:flagellar biosynthesis/type III secretory pathway M-ring protein FliF/YscJ